MSMTSRTPPYDREKAIDAAQKIFWRKGYHATSLKDLEHATSMKPGSIYAAFKSKENLFLQSLDFYYARNMDVFKRILNEAPSPIAALVMILRQQSADYQNPQDSQYAACMLVKTILETSEEERKIADCARAHLDDIQDLFAYMFELAIESGEIAQNNDPAALARLYQANLTSLRLELHRQSQPCAVSALAESFIAQLRSLKLTDS